MVARLTIVLNEDEQVALCEMAEEECRLPREQLRFWIRQEAQRRGLLRIDAQVMDTHGDQCVVPVR